MLSIDPTIVRGGMTGGLFCVLTYDLALAGECGCDISAQSWWAEILIVNPP